MLLSFAEMVFSIICQSGKLRVVSVSGKNLCPKIILNTYKTCDLCNLALAQDALWLPPTALGTHDGPRLLMLKALQHTLYVGKYF